MPRPPQRTEPVAVDTATPSGTTRAGRSRGRLVITALFLVLVAALAATIALRPTSPVGHWDGARGQSLFLEHYEKAFEDLPDPERTLDVRTDYGIVRVYRFAGRGESSSPLVLLPGTLSSTPVWADNLPDLLDVGDVYTVDLLGEPGRSVQERPIRDDDQKAEWLDQTLDALPEPSFHLVGLSIGGWTAANLALRRPEHVTTLTMIEPVNVFGDIPLQTVARSIPAAFSWLPRSWRDDFSSYTAGGYPVEGVAVADMIEAGMKHYRLRKPRPTKIEEEQLRTLRVPVLSILAGQEIMHDGGARAVAERAVPDGEVRFYPDASHAINGEYQAELAADIDRFVDAHDR